MSQSSTIHIIKKFRMKDPIMIVGLPGIGSVGRLVAKHLIKELGAKKFATLNSIYFPHNMVMLKSGTVRSLNNRFYYASTAKSIGRDIIILTGDTQAVSNKGQYAVNQKIADFFKERLNGSFMYTIGGYASQDPSGTKVYANATTKEVVKEFAGVGVTFGESRGMIYGSAGLLIMYAKRLGMGGICIMGETALNVDPNAAKNVIKILSKKLGMKIDTSDLDKLAHTIDAQMKELEERMFSGAQQGFQQPGLPGSGDRPSYIR